MFKFLNSSLCNLNSCCQCGETKHLPCLFSNIYFLKTYLISTFSTCLFFLSSSFQISYMRTHRFLSRFYTLYIYFHLPIRRRITQNSIMEYLCKLNSNTAKYVISICFCIERRSICFSSPGVRL